MSDHILPSSYIAPEWHVTSRFSWGVPLGNKVHCQEMPLSGVNFLFRWYSCNFSSLRILSGMTGVLVFCPWRVSFFFVCVFSVSFVSVCSSWKWRFRKRAMLLSAFWVSHVLRETRETVQKSQFHELFTLTKGQRTDFTRFLKSLLLPLRLVSISLYERAAETRTFFVSATFVRLSIFSILDFFDVKSLLREANQQE